MMESETITQSLNEHQQEVVTASPGHFLVLAGAGSGKTRVLVHRIAYLMSTYHISPHAILAVTFTNKAANEMRGRIEKLHGLPIHHMWVGTFHGLAHRLLRRHWREAELSESFQVMDSDDQLRLIKRIHRAMNLDENKWPAKQSQWFINHHKENGWRANQVRTEQLDYSAETLRRVYSEYEMLCQRSQLVDFTELLLRTFELLEQNESVRTHYHRRFLHILVDEFQDTNTIQYRWLRAIASKEAYWMAVGDDDQSIYSWRGAQVKNMQHFTRDLHHVKTIRLEQNYRSTKNILDAANAVIEHNQSRLGKTLWTAGNQGETIALFEAFNEREEAKQMVCEIQCYLQQGYRLTDFAVLYRSNAQSRVLEEALLESQIPYRIYGGFKFFERAEIKDVLSYLRLMINHHDDAAFERAVNLPARGLGLATLQKLRALANENKMSLWEASVHAINHNQFSAKVSVALEGFIQLIDALILETKELKLDRTVDYVLSRSGLMEFFKKDHSEKGLSRIENCKELISATAEFTPSADHENSDVLSAFLSELALDSSEEKAETFTEAVSLMTLHAAKGLEFPIVFMVGMEENLFPHPMAIAERNGLEEERRLCYVGMTRAMKKLFLSCAEQRQLYGQSRYAKPSRFISEIPDRLLHRIRPKLTAWKSVLPKKAASPPKVIKDDNQSFFVGQRVAHDKFGRGMIVNCEGSGDSARVQVNFEKCGTKWLVVQYARLKSA